MLIDNDAFQEVLTAIARIEDEYGVPALIVIDTLARNFGPGDENATADMNSAIGAADIIRAQWRSTVLFVHHSGHTNKDRARGAMALKAAIDAEYRLDKDDMGVVRFETTKMKDAEFPPPLAFRLRTVELGITDDEGREVTSAILDQTEYEPPAVQGQAGRGKWQTAAMEVLNTEIKRHRKNVEDSGRDPDTARVSSETWKEACLTAGIPRTRFYEVRRSLIDQGFVEEEHGFVFC